MAPPYPLYKWDKRLFSWHINPFTLFRIVTLCPYPVPSSGVIFPLRRMFEASVEMEELNPPQRHRTLPRRKVVWSRQGRHRFKVSSRLDMVGMVPSHLLVKIRSRFWSRQMFGVSEERFSAISAVCLVAGKFWCRLLNFRLPAPSLRRCGPQVGLPAPFLQLR